MNSLKALCIAGATLAISACTGIPDQLQAPENTSVISYTQARAEPEGAVSTQARWGGVIASVKNTDAGTMIEVVNFELTDWGRPRPSDQSEGRFRAYLNEFVDPMVYKKGRLISFLGTVGEPQAGKIDDFDYLFPTLQVAGKKLWEERSKQDVQIDYSPLWFRHDFYRPYPYYYPGIRVRTHDGVTRRPTSASQPKQQQQ